MIKCLVTGMPNAGKTSFVINFAEYLGLQELKIYSRKTAGYTAVRKNKINEARSRLVSSIENNTINLQTIKLNINQANAIKKINLIDSCGLTTGIHPDKKVRKAMAETLKEFGYSNLILHIIDINNINPEKETLLKESDRMVINYIYLDKEFALLINKIDLQQYNKKVALMKKLFPGQKIIPVSALKKQGFKAVKKLVEQYV